MSEISRREIMTLAGAGLVLSGCNRMDGKDPKGSEGPKAAAAVAPCQNYGVLASTQPGDQTPFPVMFNAPFIRVIHINFTNPWQLAINHASFLMNAHSDPDRLQKVKDIFEERFDPRYSYKRFSEMATHKPHQGRDYTDFSNFGFKNKHELFFFFESPLVRLTQDPLVVFSALPTVVTGEPIAENYSFVGAKVLDETAMGSALYGRGRMFRMRNYVQDKDGKPISGRKERYSMNIHFDLPCGTNQWVPMVIDPDTGNGEGHEP